MKTKPRWMKSVIKAAKAESQPLTLGLLKARIAATKGLARA